MMIVCIMLLGLLIKLVCKYLKPNGVAYVVCYFVSVYENQSNDTTLQSAYLFFSAC